MNTERIISVIRDWLGISPEYTVKSVSLRSGLPPFLLIVFIAFAVAFAVYVYRRETVLSRGRRVFLMVLRAVMFSLLLLIFFGPVLGLERQVIVRRNFLVLTDRSESMAIADKRSKPEDLTDAALATGKARFVLPETHEALARAQRAAHNSTTALDEARWEDALGAQLEVEQAFSAALKGIDAATETVKAVPRLDELLKTARDIAQRQSEVRDAAGRLEKEGKLLAADRCRQIRGRQDNISGDLDKLVADFGQISAALPADVQGQVAAVPRIELVKGLLNHGEFSVLERLARYCDIRYFLFGEKLEEIGGPNKTEEKAPDKVQDKPSAFAGLAATEKSTRCEAILKAVERYSGRPITGMILLTDGAFNDEGTNPLTVASWLKEQGIPLYVVGLGMSAPKDVGLRSLMTQDAFFPKDKVTVRVQVFSHGYGGVKTEVRVLLDGKEMAKADVELSDDSTPFVEMTFPVPEGKGGLAKLETVIPTQVNEITEANNRLEHPVRIIDQKIKVLYVEGKPRWEYRYLRVLLLRDPRLDVKFLMTQGDPDLAAASPQYLARYPERPEEAFGFDLVILGDVPAWYFSRPQLDRMVQLVRERGGSILMLAGDRYAPSTYIDTPIADLLPVKITRDYTQIPDNAYPVVTSAGRRSFALLEASEETNDAVWSLVRPLYRLPRLDGAKPAANVLVEVPSKGSDPYPLIAWHYAGTGKVMYVGADQLWRLRFKQGDRYHARFWGQAIQFLALSRLLGENKRIRIEVDRSQPQPGQPIEISAYVLDESFQPIKAKEYTLYLDTVDGKRPPDDKTGGPALGTENISLAAVPQTPGLYKGTRSIAAEGRYLLRTSPAEARFANTVDLVVAASNREQQEPAMQESRLRKMADLSGGQYFTIRQWPALSGMLEAKERVLAEPAERSLWDNWVFYTLFILCAGTEWLVRRRSHLM